MFPTETVYVGLYQCPPPVPRNINDSECKPPEPAGEYGPHLSGAGVDYRGNVLLPFYKGSTTYKSLMAGLSYRLNKYFIVHSKDGSWQRGKPRIAREGDPSWRCDGAGTGGCGTCFTGEYFCSRCANVGGTKLSDDTVDSEKVTRKPTIVIRNFTRSCHGDNYGMTDYEYVDEEWKVETNDLCCFFYVTFEDELMASQSDCDESGNVMRPPVEYDHMDQPSKEAYVAVGDEGSGGLNYLEVKVGEYLLRIAKSVDLRFENIVERLLTRNMHVRRIFDGFSGASILPCEFVMHFSSRLEAICATAFPVTSAERIATVVNGFGVKRVRVWENDMEIQTPISASECDLLEGSRSFTSSINSSCDAADFSDTDSISNSEMSNVGWSTGTQSHAINESFSSPASHVRPLPAGSLSCSEEVVVGSGFGNSSPEVLFNNMTMSSSSNVDSPFTSVSSQCTCPTSGSSGTQMSSPKGETTTEKQTDWSSTPDNSNDKCRIAGEDGATTEGSGQLLQSLIVTTQQDLYVDFDAEYDDNDDINYDF